MSNQNQEDKKDENVKSFREIYGISDSLRRLMYENDEELKRSSKRNSEYDLEKAEDSDNNDNYNDMKEEKKNISRLGENIEEVKRDNSNSDTDEEESNVKTYVWDKNFEKREQAKEEGKNYLEEKQKENTEKVERRTRDVYTRSLEISDDQKAALDAFFSGGEITVEEAKEANRKKKEAKKKNEARLEDTDLGNTEDVLDEKDSSEEIGKMEFDFSDSGTSTRIDSNTNIIDLAKKNEKDRKREADVEDYDFESEIKEEEKNTTGYGFQIDEDRLGNLSTNIYVDDYDEEEKKPKRSGMYIFLIILEVIIIILIIAFGYIVIRKPEMLDKLSLGFITQKLKTIGVENEYELEIPRLDKKIGVMKNEGDNIDKGPVVLSSGNEGDNIVIAGHNRNGIFDNISELKEDDNIILTKDNLTAEYTVVKKKRSNPENLDELKKAKKDQVILMTCTENENERLIIVANKGNITADNTNKE